MRILIAEDEFPILDLLVLFLTSRGHKVVVAEDGVRALERFRQEGPFDFVLSDYQMPEKNGVILCKEIRELEPKQKMALHTASYGLQELMDVCGIGDVPVIHKGDLDLVKLCDFMEKA